MASVTPQQATEKWVQRLGQAGQQITDGVNGVSVAPGAKAAAAKDLWAQRVFASKDKWASMVSKVTLGEWQAATIAGIPRIAQGAQQKRGKYEDFATKFLPYLDQGVAKVDAMPKGDLQASINRAVAMIQHNAAFRR